VKQSGREAEYSPPSSTYVKNVWNYTPTPPYIIIAWYLIK